jgi:hypothetical protein
MESVSCQVRFAKILPLGGWAPVAGCHCSIQPWRCFNVRILSGTLPCALVAFYGKLLILLVNSVVNVLPGSGGSAFPSGENIL